MKVYVVWGTELMNLDDLIVGVYLSEHSAYHRCAELVEQFNDFDLQVVFNTSKWGDLLGVVNDGEANRLFCTEINLPDDIKQFYVVKIETSDETQSRRQTEFYLLSSRIQCIECCVHRVKDMAVQGKSLLEFINDLEMRYEAIFESNIICRCEIALNNGVEIGD